MTERRRRAVRTKARLYYHGTSDSNAKKILKEGFHKGTWFASDLATSIEMGGPVVFWVLFDAPTRSDGYEWQFTTRHRISASRICTVKRYTVELVHRNSAVRRKLLGMTFRAEHGPNVRLCSACHGDGEIDHERNAKFGRCIPCERCDTNGYIRTRRGKAS